MFYAHHAGRLPAALEQVGADVEIVEEGPSRART